MASPIMDYYLIHELFIVVKFWCQSTRKLHATLRRALLELHQLSTHSYRRLNRAAHTQCLGGQTEMFGGQLHVYTCIYIINIIIYIMCSGQYDKLGRGRYNIIRGPLSTIPHGIRVNMAAFNTGCHRSCPNQGSVATGTQDWHYCHFGEAIMLAELI